MILEIADWKFFVDVASTMEHTAKNALDHCNCGYCRNYYCAVGETYPQLRPFLAQFGVNMEGPSELMPFEPTCVLACYRVHGEILHSGKSEILIGGLPVVAEPADGGTFLLWIGEMALPWILDEDMDEVISPANLPEFLERMQEVWLKRNSGEFVFS